MKRFKTKKVISEAVKPTPFEFCELCGHTHSEGYECVKVKFKMLKNIPPESIFTIVKYYKDSLQHSMVNCFGIVTLANLHDQIEFVDGNSLIGKQVVRKVKRSLSKKSKG